MDDQHDELNALLLQELLKVRLVGANKMIRPFLQRWETWELLLIVHVLSGDRNYGIEDYLDNLQTLKCTRSTLRNFIRDRIAEGTFLAIEGDKKSRKCLCPSDKLREELKGCFEMLRSSPYSRERQGASYVVRPYFSVKSGL